MDSNSILFFVYNAGAFREQCHLFSVLHEYARVRNFIDFISFNEGSANAAAQDHTHTHKQQKIQSYECGAGVDIRWLEIVHDVVKLKLAENYELYDRISWPNEKLASNSNKKNVEKNEDINHTTPGCWCVCDT